MTAKQRPSSDLREDNLLPLYDMKLFLNWTSLIISDVIFTAGMSLSSDTRAVVPFPEALCSFFYAGEQCDISPLPSFSLFALFLFFIAGYKDEMWRLLGLFLQHHCGALSTKSPRQWWDKKWVCNPLLLCFSTSDTCLEPCVKVKTCSFTLSTCALASTSIS